MPELVKILTTYLLPAGIFAASISFMISQWRQGGSKASIEVIATYREQVQQLKNSLAEQAENHTKQMAALNKTHSEQMSALTEKVGQLSGELKARDGLVKELKDILTDREKNSEMLQFYKMGNEYFKQAQPILNELKNHLSMVSQ